MQFSKLAVVAVVAQFAAAQTVTVADLPSCALAPALAAIGTTGCATTDLACVCKDTSFITSLTVSVKAACDAADTAKAASVAVGLCAQAGVTITLPGSSPAVTSSSAAPAPTTTKSASAASSVPSVTKSTAPTTQSAPVGTGTVGSVVPPKATAAFTGGAPSVGSYAAAGFFGALAMFAL